MSDKPKELIFEEEARNYLLKGIQQLTDVVGVTLGPKGRYVGLDASYGAPKITNDAGSILGDIELKNQYENMGAAIGKEMAAKMKESCGDGTTTATLLLHALVKNGVKNIASGASPIHIKRGIEKAIDAIVEHLDRSATAVEKSKEIEEIATAAASGDSSIGKQIASAFEKVGKEGVISIEEAKGTESSIEMVEGMQFDRGYMSAYFCTSTEKMICEMQKPCILITDQKIHSVQEILPLLETAAQTAQEILLIAEDIEGDALSTLVINRLRGSLKVCAVKAPGFGDRRKALLQDIAILVGATLISEEQGTTLKDVDNSVLGGAEKVIISKDTTTIISGNGNPEAIAERVKQLESELQQTESSYDKEKIQERKAKLSGGVAVIRVGAPTEPALKQKKRLYEDSLSSTHAAIDEGVVVGGGVALLRAGISAQKKLKLSAEEEIGARIAFEACRAPLRRLAENSGFEPSLIQQKVLEKKEHYGFNVLSGKIEDLFKMGIRDPLKMVKNSLKFAASAAGVVLLSECLIGEAVEDPE